MLSAYLTGELANTKNAMVLYFFCSGTDGRRRKADAILRSLLYYFLRQAPKLLRPYVESKEIIQWDLDRLWEVFECVVDRYDGGPIFCLVDGLDECEEETWVAFSKRVQRLFAKRQDNKLFKMIITSRWNIPHTKWLDKFKWTRVSVDTAGFVNDIKKFMDDQLEGFSRKNKYSESQKNKMRELIDRCGDGTFLWASLMMEQLWDAGSLSANSVFESIESFPPTVWKAYGQVLTEISQRRQKAARNILRWILFAKRPLTLAELRIAIAIKPEFTSIDNMQDDLVPDMKEYLSATFRFLLTIDDDEKVYPRHQSLKDFLTSKEEILKFDYGDGFLSVISSELSPEKSNHQLAIDCLHYLSFEEIKKFGRDAHLYPDFCDLGRYPFLDYAVTHWTSHVGRADREETGPVSEAFLRLAQSDNKYWISYRAIYRGLHGRYVEWDGAKLNLANQL